MGVYGYGEHEYEFEKFSNLTFGRACTGVSKIAILAFLEDQKNVFSRVCGKNKNPTV
jgi:hypothetical protein